MVLAFYFFTVYKYCTVCMFVITYCAGVPVTKYKKNYIEKMLYRNFKRLCFSGMNDAVYKFSLWKKKA